MVRTKLIAGFLCVALCLAVFTGCGISYTFENPVQLIQPECMGDYIGTVNGYAVSKVDGQTAAIVCKKVAEYYFAYGSAFTIYAEKDGQACTLEEAYENGLLTDADVATLHQMYIEKYPQWTNAEEYYSEPIA